MSLCIKTVETVYMEEAVGQLVAMIWPVYRQKWHKVPKPVALS